MSLTVGDGNTGDGGDFVAAAGRTTGDYATACYVMRDVGEAKSKASIQGSVVTRAGEGSTRDEANGEEGGWLKYGR